jgi:hypothetical protein
MHNLKKFADCEHQSHFELKYCATGLEIQEASGISISQSARELKCRTGFAAFVLWNNCEHSYIETNDSHDVFR